MMKVSRNKRGQFVIIAALLAALMIVSIGALMHGAVTYYKHEPWEEYSTLIGDIELNSGKLVELSLVKYTNTDPPQDVLYDTLKIWQDELPNIYPSSGIVLISPLLSCIREQTSEGFTSIAEAHFHLAINSIGLKGYEFTTTTSLSLKILTDLNIERTDSTLNATTVLVKNEKSLAVQNLQTNNFLINGDTPTVAYMLYLEPYGVIYQIQYEGPYSQIVEVCDQRGIRVSSNYP